MRGQVPGTTRGRERTKSAINNTQASSYGSAKAWGPLDSKIGGGGGGRNRTIVRFISTKSNKSIFFQNLRGGWRRPPPAPDPM